MLHHLFRGWTSADNPRPPPPRPQPRPGYLIEGILGRCGLHEVPQVYIDTVDALRARVKTRVLYQNPPPDRYATLSAELRNGQYTKIPAHLRVVPEEKCPWTHMRLAAGARFPRPDTVNAAVSPMHGDAAQQVVARWDTISTDRMGWIADVERLCEPLRPLDTHLRGCADPRHAPIQKNLRVATMCALLEPLQHSDTALAAGVLFGMPVYGDGQTEPAPDNSGLFRQVGRHADFSTSALHAGSACPTLRKWVNGKCELSQGPPYEASPAWFDTCRGQVTSQAKTALVAAGIHPSQAANAIRSELSGDHTAIDRLLRDVPTLARSRLKSLLLCETKSRKEARDHLMEQPVADENFAAAARQYGGLNNVRVSRRHCIPQGYKVAQDGSMEEAWRVIDDTRQSGMVRAVSLSEKVDLPSFLWPAQMAIGLARIFYRRWHRLPTITFGADDMKSAFRTVAKAIFPAFGFIVWWSFLEARMMVQRAYGHFYGDKAGVNNFERVSRAGSIIALAYGLVLTRNYVDDYLTVDLETGGQSAQTFLKRTLRLMGWDTEARKHKPMHLSNVGLGALTDLTRIPSHGTATVEPDLDKLKDGLHLLHELQRAGSCRPSEASTAVGKWRWMTQQAAHHAGAAALQPWQQRANGGDSTNDWTREMDAALEFLSLIYSPEFLPRLTLHVFHERAADEPFMVLYSDAEHFYDLSNGWHVVRLCWHAFDTACPLDHHTSFLEVPQEYLYLLIKRSTYIGQGEEMAGISALFTAPQLFKGRRVLHFVDNAGSLSHIVNGYANAADSAQLVNMFHAAAISLGIEYWGEWVPSKANIADMLTRPDRHAEWEHLRTFANVTMYPMKLPPIGDAWSDLSVWMRAMQAL